MKKMLTLLLLGLTLSGCAWFRPHKFDVIQGNVISQAQVNSLHRGMTTAQVKDIMGSPMLVNIFTNERIDYVYTIEKAYQPRQETRVTCLFRGGRLSDIITS